jgi:hypothetical protein
MRLTQGSPPVLTLRSAGDVRKPDPIRRTRRGLGAEGGRFTSITEDSGPVKPGNHAMGVMEGKTLKTRQGDLDVPVASPGDGKSWTIGDGDSEEEPNQSCKGEDGTRKPKGIPESC